MWSLPLTIRVATSMAASTLEGTTVQHGAHRVHQGRLLLGCEMSGCPSIVDEEREVEVAFLQLYSQLAPSLSTWESTLANSTAGMMHSALAGVRAQMQPSLGIAFLAAIMALGVWLAMSLLMNAVFPGQESIGKQNSGNHEPPPHLKPVEASQHHPAYYQRSTSIPGPTSSNLPVRGVSRPASLLGPVVTRPPSLMPMSREAFITARQTAPVLQTPGYYGTPAPHACASLPPTSGLVASASLPVSNELRMPFPAMPPDESAVRANELRMPFAAMPPDESAVQAIRALASASMTQAVQTLVPPAAVVYENN